jgi:hypothetical protein
MDSNPGAGYYRKIQHTNLIFIEEEEEKKMMAYSLCPEEEDEKS